jgi:hypothetical protein
MNYADEIKVFAESFAEQHGYVLDINEKSIETAVSLWTTKQDKRPRSHRLDNEIEQAISLLMYLHKKKPFERKDRPDPRKHDGCSKDQINEQIPLAMTLDTLQKKFGALEVDSKTHTQLLVGLRGCVTFEDYCELLENGLELDKRTEAECEAGRE